MRVPAVAVQLPNAASAFAVQIHPRLDAWDIDPAAAADLVLPYCMKTESKLSTLSELLTVQRMRHVPALGKARWTCDTGSHQLHKRA
jgi:hypothetical protein